MKVAITLTWSKVMATVIFLAGLVFSLLILKQADIDAAKSVFINSTFVSAGMLGWRQATSAVKGALPTNILNRLTNDNRLPDESSEVPVADA